MKNKQPVISLAIFLAYIAYILFTYPETGNINDTLNVDNQHYAIFLSICILIYAIEKVVKNGLKAIIFTDVALVVSFIYWSLLDIVQSRYPLTDVSLFAIKYTFVYIAVFIVSIIIGTNFNFKLSKIIVETASVDVSERVLFIFFIVSFLLAIFYFWKSSYYEFDYMIQALTRPRFRSPWARGAEGGFGSLIEHLKYFGYFLPSLAVLYALKVKKLTGKVVLLFFLAVFFSAFEFQGGGRRITGFLVGVAVITYLVSKRNQLRVKHLFGLFIISVGLLVLLDMQLAFRNSGYDNMIQKYDVENLNEVRVDDNFLRIAQLIDWIPNLYPYAGSQWLIYSFGRPIPRYFWESKPLDPGYDVAKMAGEFGVSLTTTVVGEAYASGGLVMIIIVGLFYGVMASTVKQLLNLDLGVLGFSLYSIGTLAIVGGVRALVDMIIFSYAFFGLIALYKYFIKKRFNRELILANSNRYN
ncbi:oligosaccharide repeat unit polymerase [bacterium]|nr:MAG: oligosaccharide repeat unit polymerase [bacterium]